MKVCFYGAYDKDYARNSVLINGLRQNDIKVCEHNSTYSFFIRTLKLFFPVLFDDFDVLWVGFPGHLDVFPARIISWLKRKPLVFDAFISKLDAEKEYGIIKNDSSFRARFLRFIDRYSCLLADKIFLDTPQHVDFFVKEFSLPREKFEWLFIGANESLFYPRKPTKKTGKFKVLYFGRTVPLHGLELILKAAELLKDKKNIEFLLFGENIHFRRLRAKYSFLSNCWFFDALKFNAVPKKIAEATVCLGVFGRTPKADRVIPNKVFEPLAMGKPVITGVTPATQPVFQNKENILLCEREPEAIARAILLLKNNSRLRVEIGKKGLLLFKKKFSAKVIGKKVEDILRKP